MLSDPLITLLVMTAVNDEPVADESAVRRVRKLLDKAEGTSNPHEAEAFSRKAAEIAAAHRIDPDRLTGSSSSGALGLREIPLGRGPYVRARLSLLGSVARAHDTQLVFEARPTGTVALVAGFTDDLDVVELLYHSLHQQASGQMAGVRRGSAAATQRHRRAFLFGYAERIGQLLDKAADDAEQATVGDPASRSEVGLALRARAEEVDDYAARAWGPVRRARKARPADRRGWSAGSAAAEGADIGRSRISSPAGLPRGRM